MNMYVCVSIDRARGGDTRHSDKYMCVCVCVCVCNCPRSYIGETKRNLPKRINENRRDFKSSHLFNCLVIHNILTNHTFDFQYTNHISLIYNKNERTIIESSATSYCTTIKQKPEFFKITPFLAKMMLKNFN